MEEMSVKKLDSQGRIVIPLKWRRRWKSSKVLLMRHGDKIELTPIEPISPSALFDSIEISEKVDFTDPHSLKKALLEMPEH